MLLIIAIHTCQCFAWKVNFGKYLITADKKTFCWLVQCQHATNRNQNTVFYHVWYEQVLPSAQHLLCLTLRAIFQSPPFSNWRKFWKQIVIFQKYSRSLIVLLIVYSKEIDQQQQGHFVTKRILKNWRKNRSKTNLELLQVSIAILEYKWE